MSRRLKREFFQTETLSLATQLLGKLCVRSINGERVSGIIVECEAYLAQGDPASHSHRGPGRRNASMFLGPGALYVYSIHAKYCANIVTAPEGIGEAILIRGLQPWEGVDVMRQRRGLSTPEITAEVTPTYHGNHRGDYRDLSAGPARLCQSLDIDRSLDGVDLAESDSIWLESSPMAVSARDFTITATPRIGISTARDSLYRFFIDGHQCVSGLARDHSTRRSWLFSQAS